MRFLVLLFAATTVFAQSNASDVAMDGYIQDAAGARISAAQIAARNVLTNVELSTTTNNEGYYRFPLLKIGEMDLRVSASVFRLASRPASTYPQKSAVLPPVSQSQPMQPSSTKAS